MTAAHCFFCCGGGVVEEGTVVAAPVGVGCIAAPDDDCGPVIAFVEVGTVIVKEGVFGAAPVGVCASGAVIAFVEKAAVGAAPIGGGGAVMSDVMPIVEAIVMGVGDGAVVAAPVNACAVGPVVEGCLGRCYLKAPLQMGPLWGNLGGAHRMDRRCVLGRSL